MRNQQKKTILVVDDEEAVRKLIHLILARFGYEVLLAGCGQEAQAISRDYMGRIHLLLSDIEMPGMDGIALSRQIVAERPDTVVLLNSANTHYAGQTEFAFLAKPFAISKLQAAVAEAMESGNKARKEPALAPLPRRVVEKRYARTDVALPSIAAEVPAEQPRPVLPRHEGPSTDNRFLAKVWFWITMAPRKLATSLGERGFLPRQSYTVPVWAASVALVLAIAVFGLPRMGGRESGREYEINLETVRGSLAGEAAPAGQPLLLNLDISRLPQSKSYEIRLVNGSGERVWQNETPVLGPRIYAKAAALRPGIYFVQVYGPAEDLLWESQLRVTRMH